MNKTRRKRTRRATQVARKNGSQARSFSGIVIFRLYTECDGNAHNACASCSYAGEVQNCIYPEYDIGINSLTPILDDYHTGYEIVAQYPAKIVNRICQDEKNWHGINYSWTSFAIEHLNRWQS